MSNIPAPGSGYTDYSSYGYGGSIRNHFVDDSYSSGGNSNNVEAYKQQLQSYYQNLLSVYNSLSAGDSRRGQCEEYLRTCQEYAEQVDLQLRGSVGVGGGSEWDPNAGMTSTGLSIPISYQDANHIVTDEGPGTNITVRQTDTITKPIDVYQADNTLAIPSNAAVVSVNQVTEGTDVKWEVTIVLNGVTRKIVYHNVQREGFSLNIQAANPDQVTANAALTGGPHAAKFEKTELGSSSSSNQPAGDPPTRMDGDKRVYDGVSFDISPVTTGTNKQTSVLASGDVTITPNSNEEMYTCDYQATPAPAKYIVKVYANEADKNATPPRVRETITIDATLVDHINFGGDASRMEYGTSLRVAGHPEQLDPTKPGASKITVGTSGDGLEGSLNPDFETDTTPDSVSGSSATYNTSSDVDIHANFDDEVKTHNITAPGEVTIHGTSYSDTMEVTAYSEGAAGRTWTIKVYKDGIHDAAHTETFVIRGGSNTKVNLDVMGASSTGRTEESLNANNIFLVNGTSSPTETDTDTRANQILNDLKTILGGKTDAQILSALNANGFSFANIDALKAAMNSEPPTFPPAFSTNSTGPFANLVKALYALDGQLSGQVNASLPWNHTVIGPAYKQATQRLVSLLQELYPDHNISMTYPNATNDQWRMLNNVTFNGVAFNWTNESQNHQGEVEISAGTS